MTVYRPLVDSSLTVVTDRSPFDVKRTVFLAKEVKFLLIPILFKVEAVIAHVFDGLAEFDNIPAVEIMHVVQSRRINASGPLANIRLQNVVVFFSTVQYKDQYSLRSLGSTSGSTGTWS